MRRGHRNSSSPLRCAHEPPRQTESGAHDQREAGEVDHGTVQSFPASTARERNNDEADRKLIQEIRCHARPPATAPPHRARRSARARDAAEIPSALPAPPAGTPRSEGPSQRRDQGRAGPWTARAAISPALSASAHAADAATNRPTPAANMRRRPNGRRARRRSGAAPRN